MIDGSLPHLVASEPSMKVAIVCDGFLTYGGAERVVEAMLRVFPHADLFALVDFLPDHARAWLGARTVRTSFLQHIPGARRYFRKLLSLWPLAAEGFDLAGYDLVVSAQFAVVHGVLTHPFQPHIAYFSSPMRYAWDLQADHLRQAGISGSIRGLAARYLLHRLRVWDASAALRPDALAANSRFTAERIRKFYRRQSTVIHPPVYLDRFTYTERKGDYYLSLGRLVPHKRIDLIVDAFALMPNRKLVVAGTGPLLKSLRARATQNVSIVGEVDGGEVDRLMGGARAYIHAAVEDFGIAPVEAQATGTPVIALGWGGLLDTVVIAPDHAPTGAFFPEQTPQALCQAIKTFEPQRDRFLPAACAANAKRFGSDRFEQDLSAFVSAAMPPGTRLRQVS